MEHVALKAATTTATDAGEFEAVISTESIDRERDVVSADGMVAALHKWTPTGKKIPLAWNHSGAADQQIGYVDPASAKAVAGEVVVSGFIDQSSAVGADAWRQVKMGTLGFSFGYLILKAAKRTGGGRQISELDVFEITATPTPMNADTRVLTYKAILDELIPRSELEGAAGGELKAVWTTAYVNDLPDSAFLYVAPGGEKDSDGKTTPRSLRYFPVRDATGAVDQAHVRNALARIPQSDLSQAVQDAATAKANGLLDSSKTVDVTGQEPEGARSVDPLRRKADAVALEVLSGGESLRKPPRTPDHQPAAPRLSTAELRRQMHQATLDALTGGTQ